MPDQKEDGLEAMDIATELAMAARRRSGQAVARGRRRGSNTEDAGSVRRAAGRAVSDLEDFEAEVEASRTVVSAPSRDEIQAAGTQLKAIRNMSAKEAATRAGVKALGDAITTARALKKKTKVV